MKLLLISSFALRTPPAGGGYGGLERVTDNYAQGLQELGHDVTLVAAKESKAPKGVRLIEGPESWDNLNEAQRQFYVKSDGVEREWSGLKWKAHTWDGWRAHEEEAFKSYKDEIAKADVVLDHSWTKWSYTTKKDEIVGTCHSMQPFGTRPPRQFSLFTGVSNGHSRAISSRLKVPVRTLLNPVNIEEFPYEALKTGGVLSLNRIMPEKGIHIFVDIATKEGFKADIAGDDKKLVSNPAYVEQIKAQATKAPNITYHGLVDDKKRIQLLKDAKVLVCLKDMGYEEIFGLSAVEALACGTPVVAANSWGFAEIIENGKNGYLVEKIEEVAPAIKKAEQLKPADCRASAERFSRQNRSLAYEMMIKSVHGGSRW